MPSQKVMVEMDNRHVVPYNSMFLLKYGCHHNIEYIGEERCADYVMKYICVMRVFYDICKGTDMAYIRVSEDPLRKDPKAIKPNNADKIIKVNSGIKTGNAIEKNTTSKEQPDVNRDE
ncbi:hypothetical protein QR680_011512 [Steinernema hermaphroditum]|uniref:Uncharacterized protein n=1 Tax=Steinernema hermaphroditum TaxID=289476 RepID=A0AA39I163_9BILA|nr:hypothetical protein QR680_011512 [Steinernema hermaphroditum]